MIDSNKISLNYIKKEQLTGSFQGMRYRMAKSGDEMLVTIWPEPYNYLRTPSETKQNHNFAMTPDGKEEAVQWMNEQYEQQKQLWDLALHTPL